MPKFVVGCYSPPAGFSVKEGDTVKVKGWCRAEIIKATSVIENGQEWVMGSVPKTASELKQKIEQVTKTGVASNVIVLANAVQFDLSSL